MRYKILASIFACFVLLSLVSVSALIDAPIKEKDFTKGNKTSFFTITANKNSTITLTPGDLRISDGASAPHYITLNLQPSTVTDHSLNLGNSLRVNATMSIDDNFNFDLKTYNFPPITITATDATNISNTETKTLTFNFINSYCESGDTGIGNGLEITRLTDEKLDNEDAWIWHPLDNIELTVKVRNNFNDDLDAVVEYGLYDSGTKEFLDLDEDQVEVSVAEDESEEVTIKFQVPADQVDFTGSSNNYQLYIKAYEDGNEEEICTDLVSSDAYRTVEIKKESRDVVVSDIKMPSTALCGENIEFLGKIYNIGRKDENSVKVTLYNKELNVKLEQEIKNLDVGENKKVSFSVKIPENAVAKTYTFQATTVYDYDKNDESYGESSDSFDSQVKVEGNCIKTTNKAGTLTLSLQTPESEIAPGKNVAIKASVKNTGTETTTYVMGFDNIDFGTVETVNPPALILEAGKTGESIITIKLNDNAAGDKVFKITTKFENKTLEQPASLSITKPETGSAFFANMKENWLIWTIVLINVVLILGIIIVAVRVSKS